MYIMRQIVSVLARLSGRTFKGGIPFCSTFFLAGQGVSTTMGVNYGGIGVW